MHLYATLKSVLSHYKTTNRLEGFNVVVNAFKLFLRANDSQNLEVHSTSLTFRLDYFNYSMYY